jgi:hypothetical protein
LEENELPPMLLFKYHFFQIPLFGLMISDAHLFLQASSIHPAWIRTSFKAAGNWFLRFIHPRTDQPSQPHRRPQAQFA